MSWKDFLIRPKTDDHLVQLYRNEKSLTDAVALYLGKALIDNEAAIAICTPEHWRIFEERLNQNEVDLEKAIAMKQLVRLDAAETLALFMREGVPDWELFSREVGGIIQSQRARFSAVRAYGEMVNLLWLSGNVPAAMKLERHWNDLGKKLEFSLLCAYSMDSLDKSMYRGIVQGVSENHTHMISVDDDSLFNDAVNKALDEVIVDKSDILLTLYQAHKRQKTIMSEAQSTVLWLKEHLPELADQILDKAKTYYVASPV